MEGRRLLPYIFGLLILAFALGSLPRATPSGSLLLGSYWLVYLAYLGPIAVLGILFALVILIGLNWRDLAAGIGYGVARRRKKRKKSSRWSTVIAGTLWAIALGVLITRKGSIFNPIPIMPNSTATAAISGVAPTPPNPLPGVTESLSGFIDTGWFGIAFLGLVFVCGLVVVQAVRVSWKETSQPYPRELQTQQEEGLHAVHDAIKIVNDQTTDPRTRIIACYQHLIVTACRLGAPASPDLTARELEAAIRSAFLLRGSSINDLTRLFEEARYSLHDVSEEDAVMARGYLASISQELKVQLDAEI